MSTTFEVALEADDLLGDGPVWCPATGRLLRVDILRGLVHTWAPATGQRTVLAVNGTATAVVPTVDGRLLVGVDHALVAITPDGQRRVVDAVEEDLADNRLNGCRCDPRGRLWAGTMSTVRRPDSAALYRLDGNRLVPAVVPTTLSNGLGWSPDGTQMYFIDSTTQRIDVLDYDVATGAATARRPFARVTAEDGLPDGLAVDNEGGVWVALFGGSAIRCYADDGTLTAVLEVPVPHPTCPAFGGHALDTLYVTTTRHRLTDRGLAAYPAAGSVFACRPGVRAVCLPPHSRAELLARAAAPPRVSNGLHRTARRRLRA